MNLGVTAAGQSHRLVGCRDRPRKQSDCAYDTPTMRGKKTQSMNKRTVCEGATTDGYVCYRYASGCPEAAARWAERK
jgi:hypothetical protein